MIKKTIKTFCILLLALVFSGALAFPSLAAARGVNRNKIKKNQQPDYSITLSIGKLSFPGTLTRLDKVTDEEIEAIIKETLKTNNATEQDIGDAEAFIEKVAAAEKMTPDKIKEIRDNISEIAGVDTLVEIVDYLIGDSDKTAKEIAFEYVLDQGMSALAEKFLKKAAGPIKTTLTDTVILVNQYQKDQARWKNIADAVDMKRLVDNFYKQVNSKIEEIIDSREKGWVLNIDPNHMDSRYASLYEVPGILETWEMTMRLTKNDENDDKTPNGLYTGLIDTQLHYECSAFDRNYKEYRYKKSIEERAKLGDIMTVTSDEYQPTSIYRVVSCSNFALNIQVQDDNLDQSVPSVRWNIDNDFYAVEFDDLKLVEFYHKTTVNTVYHKTIERVYDDEDGVGGGPNPTTNPDIPSGTEITTLSSPYSAEDNFLQRKHETFMGSYTDSIDFDHYFWDSWDYQEHWLEIKAD